MISELSETNQPEVCQADLTDLLTNQCFDGGPPKIGCFILRLLRSIFWAGQEYETGGLNAPCR